MWWWQCGGGGTRKLLVGEPDLTTTGEVLHFSDWKHRDLAAWSPDDHLANIEAGNMFWKDMLCEEHRDAADLKLAGYTTRCCFACSHCKVQRQRVIQNLREHPESIPGINLGSI